MKTALSSTQKPNKPKSPPIKILKGEVCGPDSKPHEVVVRERKKKQDLESQASIDVVSRGAFKEKTGDGEAGY